MKGWRGGPHFLGLWGDIIINDNLLPEDSSVNTGNLYMDECGEVSVCVCHMYMNMCCTHVHNIEPVCVYVFV